MLQASYLVRENPFDRAAISDESLDDVVEVKVFFFFLLLLCSE
jgi:hypothetical protein